MRPSVWYCSSRERRESKGSALAGEGEDGPVVGLVMGWVGVDMMCGFVGWVNSSRGISFVIELQFRLR